MHSLLTLWPSCFLYHSIWRPLPVFRIKDHLFSVPTSHFRMYFNPTTKSNSIETTFNSVLKEVLLVELHCTCTFYANEFMSEFKPFLYSRSPVLQFWHIVELRYYIFFLGVGVFTRLCCIQATASHAIKGHIYSCLRRPARFDTEDVNAGSTETSHCNRCKFNK